MPRRLLLLVFSWLLLNTCIAQTNAGRPFVAPDPPEIDPATPEDNIIARYAPLYNYLIDTLQKSRETEAANVLRWIEERRRSNPEVVSDDIENILQQLYNGLKFSKYDIKQIYTDIHLKLSNRKPPKRLIEFYESKYVIAVVVATSALSQSSPRIEESTVMNESPESWSGLGLAALALFLVVFFQRKTTRDFSMLKEKIISLEQAVQKIENHILKGAPSPEPSPIPPPIKKESSPTTATPHHDAKPVNPPQTTTSELFAAQPNGGVFASVSDEYNPNIHVFKLILPFPNSTSAELWVVDDPLVRKRLFSNIFYSLNAVANLNGLGNPQGYVEQRPGRVIRDGEVWKLQEKINLHWT